MNQVAKIEQTNNGARGLTVVMAEKFQMEPAQFVKAIKETVIKGNATDGQLAAFLMVAHEYGLNPLTKEVYAFPSQGGIQPIVSIDGWMKLMNSHPQFDGMEFQDQVGDDGKLESVTCRVFRKDRSHPTEATEYMVECERNTEPWKKWPRRMLRHKSAIQCARYAFSFAGIMDEDEYERMKDVTPAEKAPLSERIAEGQKATQHIQDEQEGFDPAHVSRETETRVSDAEYEEEQQSEAALPPDGSDAPAPPSDAGAEDDGGLHSPPPSSSPDLIECCRKLLALSVDETMQPLERRQALASVKNDWKAKLPKEDHDKLRAFFQSADAIIKGDEEYETAVQFYAEMLGVEEDELRGSE